MNYKIKIAALLIFPIVLGGCKKESAYYTDTPVIESYLHPGDYLRVTISRQTPFLSDVTYSEDDINNLSIQVEVDNVTHTLMPLGEGEYIDSSVVVAEGKEYHLTFRFNAKDVTAYTVIPSRPVDATQSATEILMERVDFSSGPPTPGSMPDPIQLTWSNPDNSYYLVHVENIETTLDPIVDFGGDLPERFFRKPPINTSSARVNPTEFQYFGTHRIILYHLLPDYAGLFNDNNTSSQNLTNPSTSITNGYGIFTGLNSDTLWVEVIEQ